MIPDNSENTDELIKKAISRKNLGRGEQTRIGHLLKDALALNKYQAKIIREMKDEIVRLKIETNKGDNK